jgi:RNA polymerase sigma factor (sigma-70 family)
VKPDLSAGAERAERFNTTRWSVVLLSAQSRHPGSAEALSELCQRYWYPLYGFTRRRGYNPEESRDLTQGFFLHLLERRTLTRVDPEKGKFRSFLLASLQNFLLTKEVRNRCLKRGGRIEFVSFDATLGEDNYRAETVNTLTPEKIFDARWGMALLGQAMTHLKNKYSAQGKSAVFEVLKPFVDIANRKDVPPYQEVADELKVSAENAKVLIHRLRKQYTSLVREEIARTVEDAADIDGEVHALCEAIIAAEGHIRP